MTLTITLTFEEEVRLRVAAQKEGKILQSWCISLSKRIFRQRLTKMPPPLLAAVLACRGRDGQPRRHTASPGRAGRI